MILNGDLVPLYRLTRLINDLDITVMISSVNKVFLMFII